ncbi:hypothetical protein COV06_00245 [Candidatus Uhrbacteria bacterium CG10_big_fil_rev_8_21_14_0_10_50_16]|uniref:Aminotransferase class I/classII large domain-containing protein n=1 Tax=Candidatus Uhrbacteria bacterium CG10_big_fil_rev_8_21_14_0_10_50_16 TaxID=1975039 RepID=A0A2H0RMP3_9BACT|nr:MAG: hypothetical protein COV06_00245 [Candidatus Uhrbacteria bacterium CG10_big_fil_rev_8_21_14_0_10_50_16]
MKIDLTYHPDYAELTSGFKALREIFSDHYRVDSGLVIPTNGATGALDAVFSCTLAHADGKPTDALVSSMEYFDAVRMLKLYGFGLRSVPSDGINYPTDKVVEALRRNAPSLFYLSVPNNPSGRVLSEADLGQILEAVSDKTRVLIDITLIGTPSHCLPRELLNKHDDRIDIVVVDSLSKKRGLVRDRGWAIVALRKSTADRIHPFAHATNLHGMQTAIARMNDVTAESETHEKIRTSQKILDAWSNDFAVYHPSNSNFACIELLTTTGSDCKQRLEQRGIKLRAGADLYIDDKYIRIDMEQPKVLQDFLSALDNILVQ